MLRKLSCFLFAYGIGLGSAHAAAVLQLSGGELTGALDVNVSGTLYDVEFVEGTCIVLFSGCDEPSDFTFTTMASGRDASFALLNQVFRDVPAGNFDSDPSLTFGCEPNPTADFCLAITPWGLTTVAGFANTDFAANALGPGGFAALATMFVTEDTTAFPQWVYARWTPATVEPVPEPGTVSLLALGVLGLRSHLRRRS